MAWEQGSLIGVQYAIQSGQSCWTAAGVAKPPVGVQSAERTLVFSWIPTTALKKERKTKHYCSCNFTVRPAHTPHVNVMPCVIQPLAVHLCRSLVGRSADLFSNGVNHEECPGSLRTTETCVRWVLNIQFLLFIQDACGLSAHFILYAHCLQFCSLFDLYQKWGFHISGCQTSRHLIQWRISK